MSPVSDNCPSLEIVREVAREFVRKGYYAKITFFTDGRGRFQYLVISRYPLTETVARCVFSEMIH